MERPVAGKVKLVKIDTRTARAKLAARGQPYYSELLTGLSLGYRKGLRRSRWVLRRWDGEAYVVTTLDGETDDHEPANGKEILSFDQAKQKAFALADGAAKTVKGLPQRRRAKTSPATVREAVEAYLAFLDQQRKSGPKSRALANASILPELGDIRLRDLTKQILTDWLYDLAASARRTRAGVAPAPVTNEECRKRRASANRVWTVLKAALNMALAANPPLVASDAAWRTVKSLGEANAANQRLLTLDEMRRIAAAAENDPDFRALFICACHSGLRYGELSRLVVGDYDPRSDSIIVRYSKVGKSRRVTLTREASDYFARLCAGRSATETLLRRNGEAWRPGQQDRPMRAACAKAGVERGHFHLTRHAYASHSIMDGLSLFVVARAMGHSSTRQVEQTYGHLSPEHIVEIQQARKPLGLGADDDDDDDDDDNVVTLTRVTR
jgi:integrase